MRMWRGDQAFSTFKVPALYPVTFLRVEDIRRNATALEGPILAAPPQDLWLGRLTREANSACNFDYGHAPKLSAARGASARVLLEERPQSPSLRACRIAAPSRPALDGSAWTGSWERSCEKSWEHAQRPGRVKRSDQAAAGRALLADVLEYFRNCLTEARSLLFKSSVRPVFSSGCVWKCGMYFTPGKWVSHGRWIRSTQWAMDHIKPIQFFWTQEPVEKSQGRLCTPLDIAVADIAAKPALGRVHK